MAEQDAVAIAEAMWDRLAAQDWDGVRELLRDDYVQEWPQSGERIEGPEDAIAINRNFPGGMPTMRRRRSAGRGTSPCWRSSSPMPDGSLYQGVSIVEVRDGKVVKETDYFAQPFDPPQWRAQWVRGCRGELVAAPARGRPGSDARPASDGRMVAVVLGSAVVFLDTSVVNLALPRIGEELSSSLLGTLEAQSYVAYGYFVTLSALLILAGGLTDYYGRRRRCSRWACSASLPPRCCAASPRRSSS